MDIEERCKELGIGFVPHDDPRTQKWRKKVEFRQRWRFFIRIKDWFLLKFIRLRRNI